MEHDKHIGYEVKTLSNLIRRHIHSHALNNEIEDLTAMQSWIIRFIYDNQDIRDVFQRDLEKQFKIRRSTATEILKLMEKKELIEKEPVSYDARLKKIKLTKKATDVQYLIQEEVESFEQTMRLGLTDVELEEFFRIIIKIKSNIE